MVENIFFRIFFENSDQARNFGEKTKFVAPAAVELGGLKVGADPEKRGPPK